MSVPLGRQGALTSLRPADLSVPGTAPADTADGRVPGPLITGE